MIQRILIVTYEFPPIIGGAGVYANDLAIGLAKNDIQVDIASYHFGKETENIKAKLKNEYGIKLYYIYPKKFIHFFQFKLLIKSLVNKDNYDIIILSDARAKKVFGLFYKSFKHLIPKTVSIFHGGEINQFFKNPSKALVISKLNKRLLDLFNQQKALIVVSNKEKSTWDTFLPHIKNKIHLVNHGVNEDIFQSRNKYEVEQLKKELNIPLNKIIFLTASRLIKFKGQDTILYALKEIIKQRQDIILIICGSGKYKDKLQEIAMKNKLDPYIIWAGGVSRKKLSEYYSISDLFIMVSRKAEAFGLVYIEAAACGVPSIAGNMGGVSDAVENNISGFTIDSLKKEPLIEKINYLLNNPNTLEKMRKNAKKNFIDKHTSKIMATNLLKILN